MGYSDELPWLADKSFKQHRSSKGGVHFQSIGNPIDTFARQVCFFDCSFAPSCSWRERWLLSEPRSLSWRQKPHQPEKNAPFSREAPGRNQRGVDGSGKGYTSSDVFLG